MSTVEAVLFDFDGTLVDTVDLIMETFRYATREVLGEVLPDEEIGKNIGIPLHTQMELLAPGRGEELTRVYRERNLVVHDDLIKEYPGTHEALGEIRNRELPMGIITSKMHYMAKRAVDLFNLDSYFEFLIGSDDVEKHKPDPYPLLVAADRLELPAERCVYVGDSPHDMAAAQGAGAISIAALWGAFPRKELMATKPDFAIENISELPELLDTLSV